MILIFYFRNVDFQQSLKSIVNDAVEERFNKEKKSIDSKFESIDDQLKQQKEGNSKLERMLATLIDNTNELVQQKRKKSSPASKDDRRESTSRRNSNKSNESRSRSPSRNRSSSQTSGSSSRRNSKRDRTPSPPRPTKRSKKDKEDKMSRKDKAIANLKEQQGYRNDFTNAVTKLPKWLVEDSNINPMAYIAVRFGYIHEECRAVARAHEDRGQTYSAWRNVFQAEAYQQVKEYDEIAGRAYYTAIKAGKRPLLEKIVPYWFKRHKNRSMAQIHPNIDQKNLGVWHTDIEFLNNFYSDCGGKYLLIGNENYVAYKSVN